MDAAREHWSDARLDDLSDRMDAGFAQVHTDLRELNGRFDRFQHTLVQAALGLSMGLLGLFAALNGLIATRI
jgi:hypothetical protein